MKQRSYKVLVIGLDGATFDLMLPWIAEGRLPHLGRLVREGAHSPLESTTPPITPCAWSSFMTGKNPGKHGLFDFVEPRTDRRGYRFTNASARDGETLWACLSRHARRVGVVNVPMTYPPEPVNGYLLSGLDTPHEHSPYAYPTDLCRELRRQGINYRVDLRHLGDMRSNRRRDRRIRDLREMESIRSRAVRYLRRAYPSDFTMVVYIATDQVQHHFWHYMDPRHDKHDAGGARRYGNVIRDTYVHLDGLIGGLLEDSDEDTVVIVMSDHGFGPTSSTRIRANRALESAGLLQYRPERTSRRRLRSLAGLADRMLRSTLSPGVKAWLSGTFPRLRTWFESADEAKLDWEQTRAYVNESYRASPAVWLNRNGAAAHGPRGDEETLEQVVRTLGQLIDPRTTEQAISQIISTRDIYHGPHVDKAPDLLLSWWLDGFLLEPSGPDTPPERIVERCTSPVAGGVEFAGGHRLDGVFIVHGGPTRPGQRFEGARIIDVAPTILHLMGLPIPSDMDGRVLGEALDSDFLAQHPLEFEPVDDSDEPGPFTPTYSKQDEDRVARRLQALGYID